MQVLSRWGRRLRHWVRLRRKPQAYVLDGPALQRRRPTERLRDAEGAPLGGMVLMLDHARAGALEALRSVRSAHAERFEAGAVVVGIENLPAEAGAALMFYRRAAGVPAFAVDLARQGDRLLLQEAVAATRVAAALYRARGAALSPGAGAGP